MPSLAVQVNEQDWGWTHTPGRQKTNSFPDMPVGTISTSLLPSHWETMASRTHPLTPHPQLCIMVQNASLSLPGPLIAQTINVTPIPGKRFRDGEEHLQL